MKHRPFLFVGTFFVAFMASIASAEVVTIDVTVKAIDAKERSITVTKTSKTSSKDIELEVGKKAKILVGGKEASLDDVKVGQKASVSYETDLEVVTKIDVSVDSDVAHPLEVLNLDEINSPVNDVNPSLTSDGLCIVWQSAIGDETLIYQSIRTTPEALFSERKKLFAGFNPVIASDGQSLFFYNSASKSVNESRRVADSKDFGRPKTASGLEMVAYPTGITEDGLTLYLDIHPQQQDDNPSSAHVTTRAKRSEKWQKPVHVEVLLRDKPFRYRVMAVCPVPGDESAITCNLFVQPTKDSEEENRPVIMSRSEPTVPFSQTELLVIPKPTGEPGRLFSPRYLPATRELVFQSSQHFVDSELGKKKGVDLWLVREFEVKSDGAKPAKDPDSSK